MIVHWRWMGRSHYKLIFVIYHHLCLKIAMSTWFNRTFDLFKPGLNTSDLVSMGCMTHLFEHLLPRAIAWPLGRRIRHRFGPQVADSAAVAVGPVVIAVILADTRPCSFNLYYRH